MFYVLLNAGMDANGNSRKWYVGYNHLGQPVDMSGYDYADDLIKPELAQFAPEILSSPKQLGIIKKTIEKRQENNKRQNLDLLDEELDYPDHEFQAGSSY